MISQYERSAKIIVPAIRSSIAKLLFIKYGMTQQEIAGELGIAQAAVSKYLSGKYSREVKAFEVKISKREIEKNAEYIATHKKSAASCVCMLCLKLRRAPCYLQVNE